MLSTKHRAKKPGLPKSSGKRKRSDADAVPNTDADQNSHPRQPKRQATERPEQIEYDATFSRMDTDILADHVAKALKRHAVDASTIELEDQYVPSKALRDTSSFAEPRVAKNLPSFLKTYAGGEQSLSSCAGVASPHTIIFTASGIRAADLTRELRTFATEDSKIAKLFAKHMKLNANIEFVKKTRIGIGVGTPNRLRELIDKEAFNVSAIKRFVVDASYVDEKKRTIFDLREIFVPMMSVLNAPAIKNRLGRGAEEIEILVF